MNITQSKWADAAQTTILATIDGNEIFVPNEVVISYLEMHDENGDPVVDQNGEVVFAVDENGSNIEVVSYPNIHRQALAKWEAEGNVIGEFVALPAPPRTVAGAYFRAALTDMGEIDRVRAAVTDPIDRELFNTATEFSEDAADVNAVATALSIDLSAVFDAAYAIRAARQP